MPEVFILGSDCRGIMPEVFIFRGSDCRGIMPEVFIFRRSD